MARPVWPTNSSVVKRSRPSFTSSSVVDPDGDRVQYYFRVVDSPTFGTYLNVLVDSGWQDVPTWTPPAGTFVAGTTYYWYVYTSDGTGSGVVEPTAATQYSFSYSPTSATLSAPLAPRLYSWSDGSFVDWDPPASGAEQLDFYQVELKRSDGTVITTQQVCGNCTSARFTSDYDRGYHLSYTGELQARIVGRATDGQVVSVATALVAKANGSVPVCARESTGPLTPSQRGAALGAADLDAPEPTFDPYDDLLTRLDLEALLPLVDQVVGARLAGTWITDSAPDLLCVGVVNLQPGDVAALRGMIRGPQMRIEVLPLQYSQALLQDAKHAAVASLQAQSNRLWSDVSVFVDDATNTVVVRFDSDDPLGRLAVLGTGYATTIFNFQVDPIAREVELAGNPNPTRRSYNKFQAGLEIRHNPGGLTGRSSCTSGFTMRERSSGRLVGITAGHCLDGGSASSNNVIVYGGDLPSQQPLIGTVIRNTWEHGGQTDAAYFSIDDQAKATNQVWLTKTKASPVTRDLSERATRASGLKLCFSSFIDGYSKDTCGRLREHDKERIFEGRRYTQQYCIDAAFAREGSSGGPVFAVTKNGDLRAAGIVSTGYKAVTGTTYRGVCFATMHDIKLVNGLDTYFG